MVMWGIKLDVKLQLYYRKKSTELKINNRELIHRLNRAIGQIEAIKNNLSKNPEDQDCVQTFNQLKASINALKKFGQVYMFVMTIIKTQ